MTPGDRSHIHRGATIGGRIADATASICGSWRFIIGYITATAAWCGGNALLWAFDRYPFQFYTFSVSVLAILMSAIILLSQNRQAERDRKRDDHEAAEVAEMLRLQHAQMERLARLETLLTGKDRG